MPSETSPGSSIDPKALELLNAFFARDVARRATRPLRSNSRIAIWIDGCGPATLTKKDSGEMAVLAETLENPDITAWVTVQSIETLVACDSSDIGEIGLVILKLMAHADSQLRIQVKVHASTTDLFLKGYLSILPLGGVTVMKFLASKGLGGLGKIKSALASLREKG